MARRPIAPLGVVPLGDSAAYVEFSTTLDLDVKIDFRTLFQLVPSDTATSPYGFGTFASRTIVFAGGAVAKSAQDPDDPVSPVGRTVPDFDVEGMAQVRRSVAVPIAAVRRRRGEEARRCVPRAREEGDGFWY